MKKITMTAIGLAFLMNAASASAQTLGGGPNNFTMVDCSLLNADVTLMLTGGVVGGVTCDDTTNLAVGLSLCHTSGLTIERSAKYNHGDTMMNGVCDDGGSGDGCVETVTGSAFPSASTIKGTVAAAYPGSACDAAVAETQSAAKIVADVDSLSTN